MSVSRSRAFEALPPAGTSTPCQALATSLLTLEAANWTHVSEQPLKHSVYIPQQVLFSPLHLTLIQFSAAGTSEHGPHHKK